nr:MAG TPA: hypothetical protein [Caudoviricetes sp.]
MICQSVGTLSTVTWHRLTRGLSLVKLIILVRCYSTQTGVFQCSQPVMRSCIFLKV